MWFVHLQNRGSGKKQTNMAADDRRSCRRRQRTQSLMMAMAMTLVLLAVTPLCLNGGVQAACVMTQTCVNPDNTPDNDDCMPQANPTPVAPQPMKGPGWANVTGGGSCANDDDCHGKGTCVNRACVCRDGGMVAGAHCDEFAIQCPEYRDAACCSWQQNQGMAENFKLISSVFGKNSGGGCDACAANLMQLWCGLVCSPQQDSFMRMHAAYPSTDYRPDPMTGKERVKVLTLNVTLSTPFTCALFDSCKNTALASMSEAMKSSLGFLNYQAQTGAIGHGEFMYLDFNATENATTAFSHHVLACSNYSEVTTLKKMLPTQAQHLPSIASAEEEKACPCAACRATCDAQASSSSTSKDRIQVVDDPISVWAGFNASLVAVVYAVVLVFVVTVHWFAK